MGSFLCAALCLVLADRTGREDLADPADDPPPLLEEAPPADSTAPAAAVPPDPAAEPPPIEVPPPDAAPPAPAPDKPPAGDAPARTGTEKNDDLWMLGADYAVIFVPFIGSPLIAPLVQGMVHLFGGEAIAHNQYPNWWMGTLAGYGVFALAGAGVVGGYLLILVALQASFTGDSAVATAAGAGGIGLILGGMVLTLVEPVAAYFAAGVGARPVPSRDSGTRARWDDVRDEDPDAGAPLLMKWVSR